MVRMERIERLMNSPEPQVAYQAALATGKPADAARKRMLADTRVAALIADLNNWPGPAIASHRSASQLFHKLAFLADIGVRASDPGMPAVVKKILANRDERGIPAIAMDISEAHGGSGGAWGWALCDAPTTLYALAAMGHADASMDSAVAYLASLAEGFGWGCRVSASLGTWRGPGKKTDPCPYATLVMLKLLSRYDAAKYHSQITLGASVLLDLWRSSRERHPYIFYMGDDFRKLKLPFIWYDLLHVADVLSQVPEAVADPAFGEMADEIERKASVGSFVPESIYQPWKDWDFGQKKRPSEWLELCAARILARAGR